MKIDTINDIIRNRRSIYPSQYNDEPVKDSFIQELLNNANMAPSHKLTQPWRFKVLQNNAKEELGNFLSKLYASSVDSNLFSKFKNNKIKEKCTRSSAIIIICMQRDPKNSIPEWGRNCLHINGCTKYLANLYCKQNWMLLEQS